MEIGDTYSSTYKLQVYQQQVRITNPVPTSHLHQLGYFIGQIVIPSRNYYFEKVYTSIRINNLKPLLFNKG